MTDRPETYAKEAARQFIDRVPLNGLQRELLEAMFACAYQQGFHDGGVKLGEALSDTFKRKTP
jgi:hypothetical protein